MNIQSFTYQELGIILAKNMVAGEFEHFQKGVQSPYAPKFHEELQNINTWGNISFKNQH